jgi:curved DNA-binding protein CbpA
VLSDPGRRAEYDSLFANARSSRTSGGGPGLTFTDDNASEFEQEQASSSFFENFAQYFPSAAAGAAGASSSQKASGSGSGGGFFGMGGGKKEKEGEKERPDAHGVFGDVFEEM